ncbi:MAG: hypothetical protein NTY73_03045 [Candidatus Micrarchaeota archaeon]|nr:hypothetical protein [Candidatus Micrarchaeota archaeon]
MRRGVVFTLDALVAVVIAITALTVIMQLLSLRSGEWYKEIALYNSAQDFLTSRDKDGTLDAIFNQTDSDAIATLNSLISVQIPPSMVARINVTVCTYEGSFACNRNFTAGQAGTTQTRSVVRRVFTDTNNNYYGIATMEVGYS